MGSLPGSDGIDISAIWARQVQGEGEMGGEGRGGSPGQIGPSRRCPPICGGAEMLSVECGSLCAWSSW